MEVGVKVVGKLVIPRRFFKFCLEYIDIAVFVLLMFGARARISLIICLFCYAKKM